MTNIQYCNVCMIHEIQIVMSVNCFVLVIHVSSTLSVSILVFGFGMLRPKFLSTHVGN